MRAYITQSKLSDVVQQMRAKNERLSIVSVGKKVAEIGLHIPFELQFKLDEFIEGAKV